MLSLHQQSGGKVSGPVGASVRVGAGVVWMSGGDACVALGGVAIPLLISVQGIAKAIAICMCAWWSSYSSIDICSNNKHNENILLRMYFMNNKY